MYLLHTHLKEIQSQPQILDYSTTKLSEYKIDTIQIIYAARV